MIAVMLGLTMTLNDALYQSTQGANNNGYVATLDSIIYADVNEAGYGVAGAAFTTADSTHLTFLADINGDAMPETIQYSMTQQSDLTYNVYRKINSGTSLLLGNVTSLTFHYYDLRGNSTSTLTNIKQVRVTLVAGGSSDFKIYPANLL